MGCFFFWLFTLGLTLQGSSRCTHLATDDETDQKISLAPAVSSLRTNRLHTDGRANTISNILSDFSSLVKRDDRYRSVKAIRDYASKTGCSVLEAVFALSHSRYLRNISLSWMSDEDHRKSAGTPRWSLSYFLSSFLSHFSFLKLRASAMRLTFKQDLMLRTRSRRSTSLLFRSKNTQSNKTDSQITRDFSNSQFPYPNSSESSVIVQSFRHFRITPFSDVTQNMTEASYLNDAKGKHDSGDSRKTLYIGGLFELSGGYAENGYSELDAALLAVSHINDQDIIPGYKLQLLYNDSKCDPGVATDAFFDLIYRKSKETSLVMVMGSACTEVTKTIAEIVPYWNLILISYAATSPALSEREKYRTFFRLALGDSALNPARRMLIKHFLWNRVAALYEDLESMSLAFNGISKEFTGHGIVIKSSTSFKDAAQELPDQLKNMKDLDVRIIIAGATETAARQVFCEAYKQGMYGPRYVWILVGSYKRQWWRDGRGDDVECSQNQLAVAVEGAFTIFDFNGLLEENKSINNLTSHDFLQTYRRSNGSLPLSMYASSSYDTVWTMAYTIKLAYQQWEKNGTSPPIHQMNYDNMAAVKETFINTMENLEFSGVSGPVSFRGSDRKGIAVVYQIQAENFTQVAIHQPQSTSLNFECSSCSKVLWQGSRIPRDQQTVVARMKTIEQYVFYTCAGLCVGGIILAVIFLAYNLYHGNLKYIKLSSPKLNNVAVVGCILVYMAVIMLGVDDRSLADEAFPIVCSGRAFLLAAGFSLAFGAMFAKTFRVHQIFTRTHHGLVKSKLIQDTHLLVIIGVLLAVDSVMVVMWVVVDPMNRHVANITKQVSAHDEDLIFQEQLTTCHSNHLQKWLAAFYAYKGLLLIFGVYMAWETRHVKIPALNDSQYIGLNVYNVVIMSVSVVVISNILSSRPTLAYAMEAAFMLLSTTVTLCLLFVPKIYAIVTSGGNPVIAGMGIVVDNSNTRRFVFDDRKEIYYRAEVQNRVYKRELVELHQQVVRLQRLLEIPLLPFPRLTEELLYLLPESKVDGTPPCHKRYKRELERCNSISDGGEGVMFEVSEKDDILTEINFAMNTKPLTKRHSSVETSKLTSLTMQLLKRSLSTGGGGGRSNRGQRRKKGSTLLKSLKPFYSSESNFLKKSGHADDNGVDHIAVHGPNRRSDGRTNSQEPTDMEISRTLCKNRSAPVLDAVVCESSFREASLAYGSRSDTADNGAGKFRQDDCRDVVNKDDKDEYVLCDTSNYIHPQLFNPAQSKMFSVHTIRIESVDEDSNSNNDDNESVEETKVCYLSKSSDMIISCDINLDDCHGDSQSLGMENRGVNYGSMPALKTIPDCKTNISWYERSTHLAVPATCKSNTPSTDSLGCHGSLCTPNPVKAKPNSHSSVQVQSSTAYTTRIWSSQL